MLFLFFFLLYSIIFFIIPAVREKIKVKLALVILILVNEIIDTPPVVALKTIKVLSV